MEKIIAGNFKMNKTLVECRKYINEFSGYTIPKEKIVVLCPPAYALDMFSRDVQEDCFVGAQNVSHMESGAMTGELSASMIKSVGAKYAIVGHSERRLKMHETDEEINAKAKLLEKEGIIPIICIGEKLEEIENKKEVLKTQIINAIDGLEKDFIIAYEPVWAIGTGKACGIDDINETHKFILMTVGEAIDRTVPVLYGGSVKPQNSAEILASKYVGGVLVGGACLNPEEFYKIVVS